MTLNQILFYTRGIATLKTGIDPKKIRIEHPKNLQLKVGREALRMESAVGSATTPQPSTKTPAWPPPLPPLPAERSNVRGPPSDCDDNVTRAAAGRGGGATPQERMSPDAATGGRRRGECVLVGVVGWGGWGVVVLSRGNAMSYFL